ncbi:MAG: hypothetical protein AAFX81_18840 [Pseudomonadota bacterium]
MATKDDYELELVKAQTALALKQARTEFWKVGILIAGVTAALVQTANILFR